MSGAAELAAWVEASKYEILSAAELWHDIHPGTFFSAQVWIQREEYLGAPWLWDPFIITALEVPAWPVCLVAGGFCLFFFRKNPR